MEAVLPRRAERQGGWSVMSKDDGKESKWEQEGPGTMISKACYSPAFRICQAQPAAC